MKFDEIVSLGYNCEVAFRIMDSFGDQQSYPFSWVYILDRDLFLDALDNLSDVLSGEVTLLPWGMFKCERYQISFHASVNKETLFIDGSPNEEVVKSEISNLKDKFNYMAGKLYKLFESKKRTLFVIKVRHSGITEDVKFVQELFLKLTGLYKSQNFTLLVLFEDQFISDNLLKLQSDRLKIKSVKCFADDSDTLKSGDLNGWKSIFSEI